MIKINLLATPYINKKALTIEITFIISLFIIVASFFRGVYKDCSNQIEVISKNNLELKEEVNKLTLESSAIQGLKEKKELLQNKLQIISDIQASKVGIARVFQEINLAIPKDVWLLNLKVKNEELELLGRALNNESVLSFVKQLEENKYFKNIELKFSDSIFYNKKQHTLTKDLENATKETSRAGEKNWLVQESFKLDESNKKISTKEEDSIPLKEFIITGQVLFSIENKNEGHKADGGEGE